MRFRFALRTPLAGSGVRLAARRTLLRWILPASLTSFFVLSCTDSTGPTIEFSDIKGLALNPALFSMDDGDRVRLVATLKDGAGRTVTAIPRGGRVVWSSTPRDVVSVDAEGVVTALWPGEARVKAEFGQINAWAEVTVESVPERMISLYGEILTGDVGASLPQIGVQVIDRHVLPVSGVEVQFEILEGEGSTSSDRMVTDQDGVARVSWTLGSGRQRAARRGRRSRPAGSRGYRWRRSRTPHG